MPRVLIVDDDDNNRAVIFDALDGEDYELAEAADGHDCLKQAAKEPFDLILLDIMMPGIDGIDTLRRLKAEDATRDVPVVMVTALNMDSQVAACLDEGAIDHISKPFSNMVLRARVRAALRTQSSVSAGEPAVQRGKVLVLAGAKGGVGTTTVAVNVGVKIAEAGKSVILCEVQPAVESAAIQLGIELPPSENRLSCDGTKRVSGSRVQQHLVKHPTGLAMLPGPAFPQGGDGPPADAVAELMQGLRQSAEYSFVDIGTGRAPWTREILRQADQILVVLEMEPCALRGAQFLLAEWKNDGVQPAAIRAVINNRVPLPLPAVGLNDVRSLNCELEGVIPPDPEACFAGIKVGSPIVLSHRDNAMARALSALANRICLEPAMSLA